MKRSAAKRNSRRRRASIYVVVLGTSMAVMTIGLSALMAARIERRSVAGGTDFAQARLYAQTAIEMGFLWINNDADWRNNRANGVWVAEQPCGGGKFTLEVVDPDDDDLVIEPNDFVDLTGTGKCGEATYKLRVTIVPRNGGYEILPGSWVQIIN